MSIAALFVVTSGIGQPSSFPMQSNHFGCFINVARVVCPVIAAFCIPTIRSLGVVTQLLYPSTSIEMHDYCFVAAFGWIGASILELISSIINLVSFFRQQPWGDKFIPSEYEMEKPIGWVDTLYKSLWVGFTFARGVLSILTLYIFLFLFNPILRITTGIGAVDDCEVLRNIKSIALEWNMSGLMSSLYILLALSQLCESSGRRLSGLFYILPIMVLSCIPIGTLLPNIEENYLDVVNMPGGQLSKSMIDTMNTFP
jgi:hypothetical protein